MGFSEIIGHDRAVKLLQAMLSHGRLPHALLITGPEGVGKRSLALALAQAVNCLGPEPGQPCGTCPACSKIKRGLHPDVVELEPEGRLRLIKIEGVRELKNRVAFRPFEGRTKVFLIREADRMPEPAANALLKTLEEPPPESLLILTAPEESDLLPTIVSRCLHLSLIPLAREVIEDWLARERDLRGDRARLAAALSGGCLGRVMDMVPEEAWSRREGVVARLGRLYAARPEPALKWAAELAGDKEGWPEELSLIRFWYRDLMVLAGGGRERHLVNEDLAGSLKSVVAGRRPEIFAAALAEIERAEDALSRLIRPELVFENLMLALADLEKGING